jgi:hypothetical protein
VATLVELVDRRSLNPGNAQCGASVGNEWPIHPYEGFHLTPRSGGAQVTPSVL